MLNKPLVSIIVPVYNVEKYLKKCVDSILNQTLTNIEVILINDGSTDNCKKIIDEYEIKDKRIIAMHKLNEGQSSARNIGLDIAKGKYIGFVDSDDWIDKNMYEKLYHSIDGLNADICVCGRKLYSQDNNLINTININNELIELDKQLIGNYIVDKLFYSHTVVVWNKIYKKDIIDKNNIRFEDVSYVGSEDALFNYSVLCHANKIKSIHKVYYNQLSRETSTAKTYKPGYMRRTGNLINCIEKYYKKTKNEELLNNILPITLLFFSQWNIAQIKLHSKGDEYNLILNELRGSMNNESLRSYTKKLAINKESIRFMKHIGFRFKGRIAIRIFMMLCYSRKYKIASKLITSI